MLESLYHYKATVIKVVDGDTIDVRVDLGFNVFHKVRLRLMGLNTAELRSANLEEKAEGLAAREYVKAWFDKRGYDVVVNTVMDKSEKYGRILADVYDPAGLDCLNNDMLASGIAKPYFGGKK
jgi:micrococcal nuclease